VNYEGLYNSIRTRKMLHIKELGPKGSRYLNLQHFLVLVI